MALDRTLIPGNKEVMKLSVKEDSGGTGGDKEPR